MNILLTCVGRRNYMVDYFRQALNGVGQVFVTNTYAETAGMAVADKGFVVPPITDESYIKVLLNICIENQVRLAVPLIDMDVFVLSKASAQFKDIGALIVAPSPEVTDLCIDKWKTHLWAEKIGLNSPKTYNSLMGAETAIEEGQIDFPLVIKPRNGIGSIGIMFPEDLNDLRVDYHEIKELLKSKYFSVYSNFAGDRDILIQEKLVGDEFGLDVFNDLSGNYLACFVKEKLEMRAGETDRARTIENKEISAIGEKIARDFRHVGNLDVDIIIQEGVPYLLEVNPRFGGHYPFAHVAGANLPAAIVNMALGKDVRPEWLEIKTGVVAMKGISVMTAKVK